MFWPRLRRLRQEGIDTHVRIGVPGPASAKTLLRFAARCGVAASAKVLAKYGPSVTRLPTTAGPDALVNALAANLEPAHGSVSAQFFPFGGVLRRAQWVETYRAGSHAGLQSAAQ